MRRWPDGGAEWQISTDGGTEPVWDPDGRTLYFRRTPSVIAATLAMSEAALTVVRRDSLFSGQYFENVRWPEYDITPDGEQFVFIKLGDSTVRPVVVLNWVEQAKRGVNGQ